MNAKAYTGFEGVDFDKLRKIWDLALQQEKDPYVQMIDYFNSLGIPMDRHEAKAMFLGYTSGVRPEYLVSKLQLKVRAKHWELG